MNRLFWLVLFLAMFLAGCAAAPTPAPQQMAVEVSRPCAALAEVKPFPALNQTEALQALGRACLRDGDGEACYQFVIDLASDRQVLVAWAGPARAAIEGCR